MTPNRNRWLPALFLTALSIAPFLRAEPTTDLKRAIGSQKGDVGKLHRAVAIAIAPTHPLHDYFVESLGIIDRALGDAEADLAAQNRVAAQVGLQEATFLSSFLQEEITVAGSFEKDKPLEMNVIHHGLRPDGDSDNLPQLARLLDQLKTRSKPVRLLFPEGDYIFKAHGGENVIELIEQKNLIFEGLGRVTFVFDGSTVTGNNLLIQNCSNVRFKNISLDMRPIPFTVGTIVAIDKGNQITLEIQASYPLPDETYQSAKILRGLVRHPANGRIRRECGDPRVSKLEELGGRRYRLTLDNHALAGKQDMTGRFAVGDYFSLHPRQRPGSGNGISIVNSRHLLFDQFNVYASDAHLCYITASAGIKWLDCHVTPGQGRIIMSNADGFHCQSNPKGPYLERCQVLGMNDDCMNLYAKLASVVDARNDRVFATNITTEKNANSGPMFRVGDSIAFFNANTGNCDGYAKIKALTQNGKRLCIETEHPVPGMISRRSVGRPEKVDGRDYTPSGAGAYRAAMAIKAPFEHMIVNLNAKNDGFIIRNCEFGHNRGSGLKCKATNGVIRNTRFHDQDVWFLIEIDWMEGSYPAKVEVSDVTVDRGIQYSMALPGKRLPARDAAQFMPHIRLKNVVKANGSPIAPPAPQPHVESN
jgi:hypothetical protein